MEAGGRRIATTEGQAHLAHPVRDSALLLGSWALLEWRGRNSNGKTHHLPQQLAATTSLYGKISNINIDVLDLRRKKMHPFASPWHCLSSRLCFLFCHALFSIESFGKKFEARVSLAKKALLGSE
jgi:hypothetical protein